MRQNGNRKERITISRGKVESPESNWRDKKAHGRSKAQHEGRVQEKGLSLKNTVLPAKMPDSSSISPRFRARSLGLVFIDLALQYTGPNQEKHQ